MLTNTDQDDFPAAGEAWSKHQINLARPIRNSSDRQRRVSCFWNRLFVKPTTTSLESTVSLNRGDCFAKD